MKTLSNKSLWLTLTALALPLGACTRTQPEPAVPVGAESDARVTEALNAPAPRIATDHTHPTDVTWVTFDTFQELVTASDLVVRGQVVATRPAMMRAYGYNKAAGRMATAQEAGNEFTDIPLTISTVQVAELVRAKGSPLAKDGTPVAAGSTIEIVELGGILKDGCLSAPSDKPLLAQGDEGVYILSTAGGRLGAYHVVGGWQGRMTIRGGLVHALASDVHPNATELTAFTGHPVAELVAQVKATRIQ